MLRAYPGQGVLVSRTDAGCATEVHGAAGNVLSVTGHPASCGDRDRLGVLLRLLVGRFKQSLRTLGGYAYHFLHHNTTLNSLEACS